MIILSTRDQTRMTYSVWVRASITGLCRYCGGEEGSAYAFRSIKNAAKLKTIKSSRMCLKELLNKSEYQLNWEFKFSLLGIGFDFFDLNCSTRNSGYSLYIHKQSWKNMKIHFVLLECERSLTTGQANVRRRTQFYNPWHQKIWLVEWNISTIVI